jgi:hypothetical protein
MVNISLHRNSGRHGKAQQRQGRAIVQKVAPFWRLLDTFVEKDPCQSNDTLTGHTSLAWQYSLEKNRGEVDDRK